MFDLKQYSRDEVMNHNKPDDLWMIINDKIYDVTKFQKEHPGGEEVLIEMAGKDATREFEDVGHSSDAKIQMQSYLVGELSENERKAATAKVPGGSNECRKKLLLFTGSAIVLGIGIVLIVKGLQFKKTI